MKTKISKREEELFFGKSPAPVFDGGEKLNETAAEIAEMKRVIKEAEEFLKQEGRKKVHEEVYRALGFRVDRL